MELIGVIDSLGMRDEARDVSDESDKLASRSKMSALAGLVSSVVVGVVFVVFVVVAFLTTLVLDLVVGVVVVRDRHAINWLSSSKKKWKPPTVVTL